MTKSTREQTIHIQWHQAGQPRRYADSLYEATFTFGGELLGKQWDPPEKMVKRIAAFFLHPVTPVKDKNEERGWWEPFFDSCRKLGPSTWRVCIREPYTD